MSTTPPKLRLSFQTKVLVPVVTVMVLLMAVTSWVVNRRITTQSEQDAADHLVTATKIVKKTQEIRAANLLARYGNVVNEPRFKSLAELGDLATANGFLKDLLKEFTGQDPATIATLTFTAEKNGSFASASLDPDVEAAEFQLRSATIVQQAMAGVSRADTIIVGTNLLDVVALPVKVGEEIVGVAAFGVGIDRETALEIKTLTRTEIFFLAGDQVVVGSLPRIELYPALLARFGGPAPDAATPRGGPVQRIQVNSENYLCQADQFTIPGGTGRLEYLLLFSNQHAQEVLNATQRMLLATGLLGIGLSIAIVWFLVGRITRPLRQLRDSAEAVGRGDFSRRVSVNSNDECGELAAAFNQMTENLQSSRGELERAVETLKSTQDQLIQSEKLSGIGEFVAGVAHELNNPLTSVMGFAELLQQAELPEPQRRFLDVISKSAKRCQKIVQSLLSFARRHAPERKVVCVNEILESAVEILQYQMRTSNIEVILRLDPALAATLIDPHQMQQVFLNLINNARQAIEAHQKSGWLRVTTESRRGRVRVILQDNGPGITADNLNKIFNPFFTTKEVGKGTGLGLSLCYGIVTEHGGTIKADSEPGSGATFTLELPITREAAAKPLPAPPAPSPAEAASEGVGKRVLVVDDEDAILTMIKEALTLNGFKVDVVRDGESALRRLTQYQYDLALCDWKMPGIGGQEVYERLRAANPDMSRRLIFITGDVMNEKTQAFLQASDKVCLAKPFTLAEFRAAIARILSPAAKNPA